MKKYLRALALCLLPSFLIRAFSRLLGMEIKAGAKIGFSFVVTDRLILERNARIGHFNYINLKSIRLSAGAAIGRSNAIKGLTLDLLIHPNGGIGHQNWIYRAAAPTTYGESVLEIGINSKVTFKHHLDCTRSVRIGNYSTLAGLGSQIWTHGYFHALEGIERVRVDGEVQLGNNVNVSAGCIINPGVTIADGITVGSNVCVSKSLLKKGMYVSQGLRFIEKDIDSIRNNYERVSTHDVNEEVYVRKGNTTNS
jgi:acetyltransferase-like isoleucine patch superfamily enzyme